MSRDSTIKNLAAWEGNDWTRLYPGAVGSVRDMAWHENALFVLVNHVNGDVQYTDTQSVVRWSGSAWEKAGMDVPTKYLSGLEAGAGGLYLVGTERLARRMQIGLQVSKWNGQKFLVAESKDFQGWILDVKAVPDGLILGGDFQGVGEVRADNIIRWNGSGWSPMTTGVAPGPGGYISTSISDGRRMIFGGGEMRFAGKLPTGGAAEWDGANWQAYGSRLRKRWREDPLSLPADNPNAEILAMALRKEELILGGAFDSSDHQKVRNIARWDGREWAPMGGGYPGRVRSMLAVNDTVFVGGSKDESMDTSGFGQAPFNGNSVARWSGTAWTTLEGLKGDISKLVWFKGEILALAENSARHQEVWAWKGNGWRMVLQKNASGGIFDILVHGNTLMVLTDTLFSWNGTTLMAVSGKIEQSRGMVSDGDNVYFAAQMEVPGSADCVLGRWDGKAWHAMAVGSDLYIPRNLILHGDFLYLASLFPEVGGKATSQGWIRWNRRTGTWVGTGPVRATKDRRVLRFELGGTRATGRAGSGARRIGVDGRKDGGGIQAAGVSIGD